MDTKEKTAYFEWLRLFAAAAVVLMHTDSAFWPGMAPEGREYWVLTAWDSLVRWPVPVFVMITGALFLPRRTELKTVLTRYIPRMMAAFLFWSWIYARREDPAAFAENIVRGHYHLWYLPFLWGVYLTIPFLQKIVTDGKLTGQLLAVSLTVGALLPWLGDLAVLCRPDWGRVVDALKNNLHYTFFFDLLAAAVLGHWLNSRHLERRQRRLICLAGLLGAALTLPLSWWACARTGQSSTLFAQITAPTTLCAAAGLFVFARYRLTRLPGIVAWMAERSFGVYLSHVLVLDLLQERGFHVMMGDPVWTVPVVAAAVFAISLGITELLRRVPLVGKYLV